MRSHKNRIGESHEVEAIPVQSFLAPSAPVDLERLAELVASGESPLPESLSPQERHLVLLRVAKSRRDRLVCFVARAIAADIAAARKRSSEVLDVEKSV